MNTDTIAAISTGMTEAGIGIIRLSGDQALVIANSIFDGKDLTLVDSHTVHYGHIRSGSEIIDEVLVSVFLAPKTYTREDVVEISCHGGITVLRDVLNLVFASGARPAEPGEFTKRAFLNGRLDLSEAESVMDLIHSKSSLSRKVSISQLSGHLSNEIKILREKILHETAFIEAALDDPEHYDLDGYDSKLKDMIEKEWSSDIERLLHHYSEGEYLKNGIRTVIVGKPNVGKSSVLNRLSGKEKAIVTQVPGTTRDILEEQITLEGIPLIIIDTAGIRDTEDIVEKIGVERSEKELHSADLILFVMDKSSGMDQEDKRILSLLPTDVPCICLLNKEDLDSVYVSEAESMNERFDAVISLSAKEGTGFQFLKEEILKLFFHGSLSDPDEIYVTNQRQKYELDQAMNSLSLVVKTIELGMSEDLYAADLMDAYRYLGLIIGEEVEDDLVDKIFSDFCMGK